MELEKLIRPNIARLKPYSSARDEYSGEALVYLDANENPFNQPYNRYPDPLQRALKARIGELKSIPENRIFLGNGSDEPIDLLIKVFCEPGKNNLIITDPTYGMYQVAAEINDAEVKKVSLDDNFQVDPEKVLACVDKNTRLIFLCSPNNPSGNNLERAAMEKIITGFDGIVVADEAYIDFAGTPGFLPELDKFPNLVVLQTFSKAWGMAGIRLGMAFASPAIISVLNKVKYPYNINVLAQKKALELLENGMEKNKWVEEILAEKGKLAEGLTKLPFVEKVYPTDANFFLVKMADARSVYNFLVGKKIIVRDRSKIHLCGQSLRITIGSEPENRILLEALSEYNWK